MAVRNLPEMPCGPILELKGQRKRFHIPFGLKTLVEEMSREVLKMQPANIYDFLAAFMDERLRRKEDEEIQKKFRKSWQAHRWSWEGTSILPQELLLEFLRDLHAEKMDVEHYATVIQAAYRGHQGRLSVKEIRKSRQSDASKAAQQAEEDARRRSQVVKELGEFKSQGDEDEDDFDKVIIFDTADEEENEESVISGQTYAVDVSDVETDLESVTEPIIEEPPDLTDTIAPPPTENNTEEEIGPDTDAETLENSGSEFEVETEAAHEND